MTKKIKSNNSGITLIALVVTIIVLMILAGIAVAALMGDNGIIKRVGEAKESQRGATVQDEVTLAIAENEMIDQLNSVQGTKDSKRTKSQVVNELAEKGYLINDEPDILLGENGETEQDEITIGSITIDFSKLAGRRKLDATGNIRITDFSIEGTPVENVPLPSSDFEKVAGTEIDNSYVARGKVGTIYEGDEFVWVPVDKNQEFSVTIEGSGNIDSVVLTNPIGNTKIVASNIIAPIELKEISPVIDGSVYNGLYQISLTTSNEQTLKEYVSVHSLYAHDVFNDYSLISEGMNYALGYLGVEDEAELISMLKDYGRISADTDDLTDEEIAMVYGMDKYYEMSQYSEPTDTDIDYMVRVEENGGFWIGRYEASYNATTEKAASKSSVVTRSNTGLLDGMIWYNISRADALVTAKAYNSELNSSLPTGAAWDRILGWLYEKRNSTGKNMVEILKNSSSWGNYRDDTFSETDDDLINTGSKYQTMANNIYDLAGNLEEWTTEDFWSSPAKRGGHYYRGGSEVPAINSWNIDSYRYDVWGFRLVLYK